MRHKTYFLFYILHYCIRASLPEWSKGADLRSAGQSSAWVQTPRDAKTISAYSSVG